MQQIQASDPMSDIKIPEVVPAGDALPLLLPLAAPALAYIARAAVFAIARRQKAKIENQIDSREYLQQQNELLLREILERDQDPKAQ